MPNSSDASQIGGDDGKVQRGQAHVESVAMIGSRAGARQARARLRFGDAIGVE
jgi:hypothetical protein